MPARKGKITGNYLFSTITFHCSIEVPSRTRVHARLPTAMLIFCCHKCHTRRKIPRENSSKLSKIAEISPKTRLKTHLFRCIFKLISDGHTPHLLKHIHTRIITHQISTNYLIPVTLVTAKTQKLLLYARTRAREQGGLGIFTFPQTQFLNSVSPLVFFVHPIVH